ncbi:NADP-dependent oxidoreductase domain-containing protein [Lasiosphaeria hispida]|uniref:NADP-dependent oxidoreductase domain-containing protein n=1 Tax=Lasiosphaeria hispida TaxID=260671 RepID=A0AAJ0HCU4_9PEZI|nr:NADP-dependent oxidoreductase domain-containing protein [Lasiosphaeria hispida]
MTTPTRPLGRNGPLVSAIGLGAMSIGGGYGQQVSTEENFKLLDRAWEIGERFWDTADVYRDSEDTIGAWFKRSGKRSDIFIATKFGLHYDANWVQTERSDPEYVKAACDKSLKRLGIDTIDLFYCHRVDSKTPIEKTIEAMVELKNEGKIRHLGLSEVSASTIRRAHAVHPIAAVQVEYSLFFLDIESPEHDILNTCRELGISIVAYSPVGRGLLTGQIKSFDDLDEHDFRRLTPKYSRENFPAILKLVAEAEALAETHGCTAAQVCLAWLLAQGEEIIPIPGTRTIKYLEENTAAANLRLSADEAKRLRASAESTELPGDRYPTA